MTNIVYVTSSYPFEGAVEHSFIEPELPVLVDQFEKIFIVPESKFGIERPQILNLILDCSLAEDLNSFASFIKLKRLILTTKIVLFELIQFPRIIFSVKVLKQLIVFAVRAIIVRDWAIAFLKDRGLNPETTVFYTFWFYHSAYGLSLLKRDLPQLKVISRAHGYDLYESRHELSYIPFRKNCMSLIDWVAADSNAGSDYLKKKWQNTSALLTPALLGSPDHSDICEPSNDGKFRVVSCSNIIEVKRVHLIVQGLAELGKRHPSVDIMWDHFGDGVNRADVELLLKSILPINVKYHLHGHVDISEVFEWYRTTPVDLFVNVSESEGTPMSLIEAASFGIPLVATSVGGNVEIVSPSGGILINENPNEVQIADAFDFILKNSSSAKKMRADIRLWWEMNYSAKKNHYLFAKNIEATYHK